MLVYDSNTNDLMIKELSYRGLTSRSTVHVQIFYVLFFTFYRIHYLFIYVIVFINILTFNT